MTIELLIDGLSNERDRTQRVFYGASKGLQRNNSVTFGQVLRRRPFVALWLARFVSSIGDWLALLPASHVNPIVALRHE